MKARTSKSAVYSLFFWKRLKQPQGQMPVNGSPKHPLDWTPPEYHIRSRDYNWSTPLSSLDNFNRMFTVLESTDKFTVPWLGNVHYFLKGSDDDVKHSSSLDSWALSYV
jgi:hypothetical protein